MPVGARLKRVDVILPISEGGRPEQASVIHRLQAQCLLQLQWGVMPQTPVLNCKLMPHALSDAFGSSATRRSNWQSRNNFHSSRTQPAPMAAHKNVNMIRYFKEGRAYQIVPASRRAQTPDPLDPTLSKRGWEKVAERWRCQIRSAAIDFGVYPEGPAADAVPLPRKIARF